MGDLAQLGYRRAQFGDGLVEELVDVDCRLVEVALCQADRHAQRHQSLLGAVVQVAFEAAAFGVAGVQEPGPAGLDIAQGPVQFDASPYHLDQQRGGSRDLAEQFARAHRAAQDGADLMPPESHRRTIGVARVERCAGGVDQARFAGLAGQPTTLSSR